MPWIVLSVFAARSLLVSGDLSAGPDGEEVSPTPAAATPQTPDDLRTIERQVTAAVERITRATVHVRAGRAQGSGVLVDSDGHVLTAAHVVGKPGRDVTLTLADGNRLPGKVLGMIRTADVAVIGITAKDGQWPAAEMAEEPDVRDGAWCLATGHPGGYERDRPPVVRLGRIVFTRDSVMQSDCTLVGGDSGGPLFDLQGRVIGIHSRIGLANSWNFHVPVSVFRKNWQRLLAGESAGPADGGDPDAATIAGRPDREESQNESNETSISREALRRSVLHPAFRDVIAGPSRSTVEVLCDGDRAALGCIVSADGYVLTKASELKPPVRCRLNGNRELQARLVGIHRGLDLALLEVPAEGLPPLRWSEDRQPAVGQWVVTPKPDGTPAAVGVVGAGPREVDAERGVLGISVDELDEESGLRITRVVPGSAAARAGLKVGDAITWAAGSLIADAATLGEVLRPLHPGDWLRMRVRRETDEQAVRMRLHRPFSDLLDRGYLQNRMGGGLSLRRSGFPAVFQHDGILRPDECGGPVIDLSGRAVGINIARAGRTESFAVPVPEVRRVLEKLKSGTLAPSQPERAPSPRP